MQNLDGEIIQIKSKDKDVPETPLFENEYILDSERNNLILTNEEHIFNN